MFALVFFGIAAPLQIGTRTFPHGATISDGAIFTAALLVLTGTVSFLIGTFIGDHTKTRLGVVAHAIYRRRFSWKRTILIAAILVPITIAVLIKAGGVKILFLPRLDSFDPFQTAAGGADAGLALPLLLRAGVRLPLFAVAVALTVIGATGLRDKERKLKVRRSHLYVVWIAVLVVNNPINSPRFWVGSIFFGGLILLFPMSVRRYESLMLAVLVILFIFVFPFTDSFRDSLNIEAAVARIEHTPIVKVVAHKADYDAFEQAASAVDYVNHRGYLYGANIVGALFFAVPRQLWTDKPKSSGAVIGSYKGYGNLVISMPFISELFLSGGFILASGGMFVAGYALRVLEKGITGSLYQGRIAPGTGFAFAIYAISFGQLFILWRGTLITAISNAVPLIALLVAFTAGARRNRYGADSSDGSRVRLARALL